MFVLLEMDLHYRLIICTDLEHSAAPSAGDTVTVRAFCGLFWTCCKTGIFPVTGHQTPGLSREKKGLVVILQSTMECHVTNDLPHECARKMALLSRGRSRWFWRKSFFKKKIFY